MNPILQQINRAGDDLFRAYAFNENKRQNDLANRLAEAANKRYDEQHEQQMQTQNAERMLRIFEAGSPEVAYKLSEIYGMPVEGWEGPQMQITGPRGNTWVGSRKILADATKMGLSGQQEQALQYLQENGGMVIPKQQPNSLEGMYTQAIQSGDPRQVQAVMALTEGWKGLGQQEDPYSGLTGDAKNLAIMGGKLPSLDEYSRFKEQSRPQTNVNLPEQEKEFSKAIGKYYGESFAAMQQESQAAMVNNTRLSRAESLVKRIDTGKLKPTANSIKSVVRSLGLDLEKYGLTDDVGLAEALNAVSIDLTMDTVQRTKGAVSNKEMELFEQVAPRLANTVEGNLLIIEMSRILNKNKIAVADLARKYYKENGEFGPGFEAELEKFYETNKLFTDDMFKRVEKLSNATTEATRRGLNQDQTDFSKASDDELLQIIGVK